MEGSSTRLNKCSLHLHVNSVSLRVSGEFWDLGITVSAHSSLFSMLCTKAAHEGKLFRSRNLGPEYFKDHMETQKRQNLALGSHPTPKTSRGLPSTTLHLDNNPSFTIWRSISPMLPTQLLAAALPEQHTEPLKPTLLQSQVCISDDQVSDRFSHFKNLVK